jgi:hypothetical protein
MQFSGARAYQSLFAAIGLLVVVGFAFGSRVCGLGGDQSLVAPIFAAIEYWYVPLGVIGVCCLLGAVMPRKPLIITFAGLLLVGIAFVVLMVPPQPGGCTPI